MVADEVRIRTKSHKKGEPAYEWHSDGTGKYFLNPIEKENRGTEIIVHLKDEEKNTLKRHGSNPSSRNIRILKLSHYGLRRTGQPDYRYLERTQKGNKRGAIQ